MNNMQHVRTMVQELPEKLELEPYYRWLDEEEEEEGEEGRGGGGVKLGANARETVNRLLQSADEDFDNKIGQVVNHVSKKASTETNLPCIPTCM